MSIVDRPAFNRDFRKALDFAASLHEHQNRKGTDIPYISHLVAVASLVLEHGGDSDQAIAALLHDSLEDQGYRYPGGVEALRRDIRDHFGARVLEIVESCTDSTDEVKGDWRARKEAYVAHLAEAPAAARTVSCADKLHNARAILKDLREHGDALWARFNGGKDGSLWYYGKLANEFLGRGPRGLAEELNRTVAQIDELAKTAATPKSLGIPATTAD